MPKADKSEVQREFATLEQSISVLSPPLETALQQAQALIEAGTYDHADHTIRVATAIYQRDKIKFLADKKGWVEKLKTLKSIVLVHDAEEARS